MTQITYEFALPPHLAAASSSDASEAPTGAITVRRERAGSGQSSTMGRSERRRRRGKRKPLEQSKYSAAAARSRRREPAAAPGAGASTEFFPNVWAGPNGEAKLVDISQVAYVLATIDYREGYEDPRAFELVNIWTSEPIVPRAAAAAASPPSTASSSWRADAPRHSLSVEVSLSPRYLSDLTNISEAPDEDDDARSAASALAFRLSNSLETPPATLHSSSISTTTRRLGRGVSDDELAQAASAPVSGPLQRGNSVVFSPVLAPGQAVEQTWHARFLLGLHEPVRHALFVIDRFLARAHARGAPTEWNAPEFFAWFRTHFSEFVRNQHDVKTKVLLPLLPLEARAKRDVLECYARVFATLDAVAAHEDQVVFSAASASAAWRDRLFALQSDVRRLGLLVHAVLSAEERALSPLLGRQFSESNFQRYVVPRIFRASKPKRVVIPWIVERCRVWGGDALADAYKDELPFTARFLYDRMWLPYFVSHVALAMKHLDTEMTGMLAAGAADANWLGCTIQ